MYLTFFIKRFTCIIMFFMENKEIKVEEIVLDDKDYNFKGCYDNYWNCEKCQTSCIEEVRFSQTFKEIWHSENNNEGDVEDDE